MRIDEFVQEEVFWKKLLGEKTFIELKSDFEKSYISSEIDLEINKIFKETCDNDNTIDAEWCKQYEKATFGSFFFFLWR